MITDRDLRLIRHRADRLLSRLPGVVGVGLGLRERNGVVTEELALRVYVRQKRGCGGLRASAMIPRSFERIPTDVLPVLRAGRPTACADTTTHSPLIGGITISPHRAPGWVGTLGFFGRMLDGTAPHDIALVTNRHVLAKDGGAPRDVVYQPAMGDGNTRNNPIAKILKLPEIDNHRYTYPGEPEAGFWIDCASAQLDISISTCCDTNCGVSFANEIRGLNIGGSSKLADVARAVPLETVYKVGRRTSRTVGRVIDIHGHVSGGGLSAEGILVVQATEDDCEGFRRFGAGGDSGSAVVNGDRKLVGLHYSVGTVPDQSLASHIHPVLDALNLAAITSANPILDNPAADGMRAEAILSDADVNAIPRLRTQLYGSPAGQELMEVVDRHREEVLELVNHCRPVTVVWHRHQGPAFLNRAIHNARHADAPIPLAVNGVSRVEFLAAMGAVLEQQGSEGLKETIQRYRSEVLAAAGAHDGVHELLAEFLAQDPV